MLACGVFVFHVLMAWSLYALTTETFTNDEVIPVRRRFNLVVAALGTWTISWSLQVAIGHWQWEKN